MNRDVEVVGQTRCLLREASISTADAKVVLNVSEPG